MKSLFVRLLREDAGQDLVEYAILAAFVSVAAISLEGLREVLNGRLTTAKAALDAHP